MCHVDHPPTHPFMWSKYKNRAGPLGIARTRARVYMYVTRAAGRAKLAVFASAAERGCNNSAATPARVDYRNASEIRSEVRAAVDMAKLQIKTAKLAEAV
jgi:hypothetical protein